MPPSRQLAAIMFADIVGYTTLVQVDEGRAHAQVQKLRESLTTEALKHHGRILELRSDGVLCYFRSTLEAVRAAMNIQIRMQTEPMIPLRIAIHSGDVMIEGDTMYGDGVNIASRMESLATAGSILISGRVNEDIKNQKDIQTRSLGKFNLRNVKEQIDLFAIKHPLFQVPDPSSLEGQGQPVPLKSVLVLPCLNLSNDPEQDYFSDGLTEEMISSLSRLKEIRVFSRTTSMKYKNTGKDVNTIASETGATHIMEGSVRTQANNLRISAQLIDAAIDQPIWSDAFTGTMDDIFDIQEKVASKIAESLLIQLTSEEKDNLVKRYSGNTAAYQLYLQGRFFWNKRN